MKLAEALLLRADLQKKFSSLKERVKQNALVQEGEQPHEDPEELIQQSSAVLERLERLVCAINAVNLAHRMPDGATLTESLARRDTLLQQHTVLQGAIQGTREKPDLFSHREIKWVRVMNVKALQARADEVAVKLREINGRIQEANWQIEIDFQ